MNTSRIYHGGSANQISWPGSGGGGGQQTGVNGQIFWLHNDPSDIVPYESLQIIPANGAEVDDSAVVTSITSPVPIDSYLSDPIGGLGVAQIPAGLWNFNFWHYVSSAAGSTTFVYHIFKRTSGGVETELFSVASAVVSALAANPINLNTPYTQVAAIALNTTDRLLLKVFTAHTGTGTITAHYLYDGSVHASFIITPLPILSNNKVLIDNLDTTADYLYPKVTVSGGLTKSITNPSGDEILNIDGAAVLGDHKVKASPTDTVPGALTQKITLTGGLGGSLLNPGANEQLQLDGSAVTGDHQVLIDNSDTTAAKLDAKITVAGGLSKAITSPGGNEAIQLSGAAVTGDHKVMNSILDTTPNYNSAKISAGANIALQTLNSGANESLQISAPDDVVVVKVFVDVNRVDAYSPTGSIRFPFKTIQQAIDYGNTNAINIEINIAFGNYTEASPTFAGKTGYAGKSVSMIGNGATITNQFILNTCSFSVFTAENLNFSPGAQGVFTGTPASAAVMVFKECALGPRTAFTNTPGVNICILQFYSCNFLSTNVLAPAFGQYDLFLIFGGYVDHLSVPASGSTVYLFNVGPGNAGYGWSVVAGSIINASNCQIGGLGFGGGIQCLTVGGTLNLWSCSVEGGSAVVSGTLNLYGTNLNPGFVITGAGAVNYFNPPTSQMPNDSLVSGAKVSDALNNIFQNTYGRSGVAVLSGGSITVNNATVTALSKFRLTIIAISLAHPQPVGIRTIVPGVSFTIESGSPSDAASIYWEIVG